MADPSRLDQLGEVAAARIEDGMTVGLGSGATAEAFIRALGRRVATGLSVVGVATSVRTAMLANGLGIPLRGLDQTPLLDLVVDGADEVDPDLNLIKGLGGALLREKIIALAGRRYLIIVASEKLVPRLGTRARLPIEVIPFAWESTAARLRGLGLETYLRVPTGEREPFMTDGGHVILDGVIPDEPDIRVLSRAIKEVVGVVEHGVFAGMADEILVVDPAAQIRSIRR
ncbi:MAG: ribose-5-phosphate isomerase RpiA [Chloroflexota bacterium]|nr:ribose-5-phosphate isomerase RpiA [Chloroflexota bacterium]